MADVNGQLRVLAHKTRARVGYPEAERQFPQLVQIDAVLTLDFSECLISQELNHTVDYEAVVQLIENLVTEYSWHLVERMAYDLTETILSRFPRVLSTEVTVTKFVRVDTAGFSTTIRRERKQR